MNPGASRLLQIFEGEARQEENADLISRRMKYDPTGRQRCSAAIRIGFDPLPDPKRHLPMLEQVAGDPKFVDIARQRARSLAERIRHQG